MNGREILEAMSFIDDELLAASEVPVRKAPWRRWAALAACLCILMLGTFSFLTIGRGGTTEDTANEAAVSAVTGTAGQAAPGSAAEEPREMAKTETAADGSGQLTCDESGEAAMTARVKVLELTEEGFTAQILETSYPFTEEETVTVVLADGLRAELTVGGEYTIYIEAIDDEAGALLVYAVE